ncbi:MAG: TIGR03086 family metal-binding protein, partial [Chloroflexota bacterium]
METLNPRLTLVSQALDQTGTVLAGVTEEQLHDATPCEDWDVATLITHLLDSIRGFAARIGGTFEGPYGDDLPAWRNAYRRGAQGILSAWEAPDATTRTYKLPMGDIPADGVLAIQATEFLTHGWDLAKSTNQVDRLDPVLAEKALAMIRTMLPASARGAGQAFREEVAVD